MPSNDIHQSQWVVTEIQWYINWITVMLYRDSRARRPLDCKNSSNHLHTICLTLFRSIYQALDVLSSYTIGSTSTKFKFTSTDINPPNMTIVSDDLSLWPMINFFYVYSLLLGLWRTTNFAARSLKVVSQLHCSCCWWCTMGMGKAMLIWSITDVPIIFLELTFRQYVGRCDY